MRTSSVLAALAAPLLVIGFASPASAACQFQWGDTAVVCSSGPPTTCTTTNYYLVVCYDFTEEWDRPPINMVDWWWWSFSSPGDRDRNGTIDEWGGVLDTSDNCARNFDAGDRLGSNHGGPNTDRRNHTGVDLQCNRGDPVATMRNAVVVAAGQNVAGSNCGTAVILDHFDGTRSIYCHLHRVGRFLQPGDILWAGAEIGTCNSTGNSTGDHLHLIYRDGSGNRREYFNYTDSRPGSGNLDPNGC